MRIRGSPRSSLNSDDSASHFSSEESESPAEEKRKRQKLKRPGKSQPPKKKKREAKKAKNLNILKKRSVFLLDSCLFVAFVNIVLHFYYGSYFTGLWSRRQCRENMKKRRRPVERGRNLSSVRRRSHLCQRTASCCDGTCHPNKSKLKC